jgi:CelD/BcsL family acetyltransferase involved in cellulose biosynthesis
MKAELITESARIERIEDDWRALAESRGNAFVTPEWFRSWWERRAETISPLVAAVRRVDGSLAGVLPMVLDTSRRPRAIRFGGANFGDRFVPAAAESDEVEVASAVMTALQEKGLDRYMLLLDHVDQDRPWWREMQQASTVRRAGIEQQQFDVAYIQLEGLDWEGYLASRSRNFRSQIRRRERALERDHQVEVRVATEQTLEADLARLFELHAMRWQGRGRSSLEADGAKESLGNFAGAALRRGWLRLRLLEVDGVAVAAFLGWRLGDCYAFYQSGFDPSWSDKSVGVVMMATTVRSAIEEGAIEFDMLLGDEPYKQRFTNASRPVQTVILTRSMSPTRLLVAGEARARRYGRRLRDLTVLGAVARSLRRLLPTSREN